MYCGNCGVGLPNDAAFCGTCGMQNPNYIPIPVNDCCGSALSSEQPKRKRRVRSVCLTLFALLMIALLAGCEKEKNDVPAGIAWMRGGKVNEFCELLSEQEYDKAFAVYSELKPEDQTSANEWLREYVSEVKEKYYEGDYDYSVASNILGNLLNYVSVRDISMKALEEVGADRGYRTIFEEANELYHDSKWLEAYDILQGVDAAYRKYDEALKLSNDCIRQYKDDVLTRCKEEADSGAIAEAIHILDEATATFPKDSELSEAWHDYVSAFVTDNIERAEKLAAQKDYAGAKEILLASQEVFDSYEVNTLLSEYFASEVEEYCLSLEQKEDYIGIMQHLQSLNSTEALSNERISTLRQKYGDLLEKQTLEKAVEYANNREFAKAIEYIKNVSLVCERPAFTEAIEDYNWSIPKKLSECRVIEKDEDLEFFSESYDCFGMKYENAVVYTDAYIAATERSCVFYLDKRYIALTGTIVAGEGMGTGENDSCMCRIYLDGELVFESEYFHRTTPAMSISIDISGCSQLEISIWGAGYVSEMIADLSVS